MAKMISAVVLTKNEKESLKECLAGLKWCDEILVVDDNSTDKTRELAKKEGARVIERSLNNDFAAQRNFGLEAAKYDWIFFVDADERVSPELIEEIQKKVQNTTAAGFYLKRRDFFRGKRLNYGEVGGWGKIGEISGVGEIGGFGGVEGFGKAGGIKILRLARRGSGEWGRMVDEKWEVKGKTETLKNPLLHYPHSSLTEFLESINEKSTLNARRFYEMGVKINFSEWLKPLAKFIWNYFFLWGFLDRIHGFVFAVLMSLHSFAVRVKLYLIWRREGGWR